MGGGTKEKGSGTMERVGTKARGNGTRERGGTKANIGTTGPALPVMVILARRVMNMIHVHARLIKS